MTVSFEKSVICPTLIGRRPHLAMIERLLAEVRAGAGKVLLIAGEAGLGKSRLVAAIKDQPATAAWTILQGHCLETERALPYAPLIDLLRAYSLGRSSAELAPAFGPVAAELVSLLPELSRAFPALLPAPDLEKHRLFHAVAQFCVRLADSGPTLLVIEDLHWSDEASLELLFYLARHLTAQPVLLLFTYRSDETGAGLTHFLTQLDRLRLASEINLSPLGREQVERMLQAIFDQPRPVRADLLAAIYQLTDGNPFFIEEVLKAMLMAGEIFDADGRWDRRPLHELRIPRSIQDAVRQRSQQLSPGAKDILTLAAVVGRQVDFSLLQALTEQAEDSLLAHLKELIEAQLLVEESTDRFSFRHALSRAAIYATLLGRERRQLHCAIGQALARLPVDARDDTHIADLAYHFYQGEIWEQALLYARQAGERALKLYAPYAAIEHLGRAIMSAQHLLAPEPALYYLRGQAFALVSQFEPALADYQQALTLARSQGDAQAEWQALLAVGDWWTTRDFGRAGEFFQQAHDHARALGDPALIAQSLNTLGNWHMNQDRPFAARRDHEEALAVFQSSADQAGIVQTLDFLAITSYNCGDLLAGRDYYHQALPLWQQFDDRRGLLHTFSGLALAADFDLEIDTAPIAEDLTWAEKAVRVGREIGWRSGEVLALICLGLTRRQAGHYGAALQSLHQALAMAEEIEHQGWTADALRALGLVYLDLLALAEARQYLERALSLAYEINSLIWVRQSVGTLAPVYILQNELATAQTLLEKVLPADTPLQTLQQRLLWAAKLELLLAEGQTEAALALADRLLAATTNLSEESDRVALRLWLLRGEALLAARRLSEAEAVFRAALTAAKRQGRDSRLWRLHQGLASVCLAQNNAEAAAAELDAARAALRDLADSFTGFELLRDDFLRQALAQLPELPTLSPPEQTRQQFGGLTAREREVAALIVLGKSNREIAGQMIISERTAERHVANIMSKLGFNSRAQIAAWAVAHGL